MSLWIIQGKHSFLRSSLFFILQGGKLKGNRISYEALQTKVYAIFSLKTRAQMSCVHLLSSGKIEGHEYFNIWPIIDFMCSFQFKKL